MEGRRYEGEGEDMPNLHRRRPRGRRRWNRTGTAAATAGEEQGRRGGRRLPSGVAHHQLSDKAQREKVEEGDSKRRWVGCVEGGVAAAAGAGELVVGSCGVVWCGSAVSSLSLFSFTFQS